MQRRAWEVLRGSEIIAHLVRGSFLGRPPVCPAAVGDRDAGDRLVAVIRRSTDGLGISPDICRLQCGLGPLPAVARQCRAPGDGAVRSARGSVTSRRYRGGWRLLGLAPGGARLRCFRRLPAEKVCEEPCLRQSLLWRIELKAAAQILCRFDKRFQCSVLSPSGLNRPLHSNWLSSPAKTEGAIHGIGALESDAARKAIPSLE